MFRAMRGPDGLGVLVTGSTGVRSMANPSCITAAEKAEANQKCPVQVLRGLGAGHIAMAPMSGRLAAFSPCDLADLPVCPTPTCMDAYTASIVTGCIAGHSPTPDFDCNYTAVLAQLPYCPGGSSGLTPLPACLSKTQAQARDYCVQYPNFDGPNANFNAGCWAAFHDPAYKAKLLAARPCMTTLEPPHRAPAPPSSPSPFNPPSPPVNAPGPQDASMSGMLGILALVAAAGGGYYLYRRYKK